MLVLWLVGCTKGWLVRKGLRQGSPATKATQAKGALVTLIILSRRRSYCRTRLRLEERGVPICCTDLACPFPYGKGAYTVLTVYANQRLRVASVGQYVRLLLVNWTRGPHRRQKRKTVARDGTVRLHVRFGTVAFGQSVCQRTLASVGQSVRFFP